MERYTKQYLYLLRAFVSEPFIGHATDDDQSPCTTINIIYFERA